MRLRYETSIPADGPLVLCRDDGWRVEIHLRREADDTATLLAFAGREGPPLRTSAQGPYQALEQAIAAKRAIADQLLQVGYQQRKDSHPIWTLAAQKTINDIRQTKSASNLSYLFDPKDVYLDW